MQSVYMWYPSIWWCHGSTCIVHSPSNTNAFQNMGAFLHIALHVRYLCPCRRNCNHQEQNHPKDVPHQLAKNRNGCQVLIECISPTANCVYLDCLCLCRVVNLLYCLFRFWWIMECLEHALFKNGRNWIILKGRHRFQIRFVRVTSITQRHERLFVIATASQRHRVVQFQLIAGCIPFASTLRTTMFVFPNILNFRLSKPFPFVLTRANTTLWVYEAIPSPWYGTW